jgi:hypothetical protein
MSNPFPRTLLAFSGAILITVALACSDSTAPLVSRLPGTYELSTVLDSLTYSDYCSLPTQGMPPQCHDTTVVNSTGKLHGFVTIGDTVQGTPTDMTFQLPAGSLAEIICGSCTSIPAGYYSTTATVGRDSRTFQARLSSGVLVILSGTIIDDMITGKVVWHTYLGCCMVSYYTGTFIMKRQN